MNRLLHKFWTWWNRDRRVIRIYRKGPGRNRKPLMVFSGQSVGLLRVRPGGGKRPIYIEVAPEYPAFSLTRSLFGLTLGFLLGSTVVIAQDVTGPLPFVGPPLGNVGAPLGVYPIMPLAPTLWPPSTMSLPPMPTPHWQTPASPC